MEAVQKPILALALRLLAACLFATMALVIKLASEAGASLPEIMFWRQAVAVPLLLGWLGARGKLGELGTARLGSHAGRALLGTVCMVCNFGSIILLPLALATTLGFAAPLFAVLLAAAVWRQHVGVWRWSAVLLGFAGVLVIVQPGSAAIAPLGAAAGLTAALLVALLNFLIRDLGRTEPPLRTVFYFALFGALLLAPLQPFVAEPHHAGTWLLLTGIGLLGTAGQFCLTASLRHGAVASVIAMDYSALLWASLFGWLAWDHFPTLAFWLGAPIIVAAGLTIVWREHLGDRQPRLTTTSSAE